MEQIDINEIKQELETEEAQKLIAFLDTFTDEQLQRLVSALSKYSYKMIEELKK